MAVLNSTVVNGNITVNGNAKSNQVLVGNNTTVTPTATSAVTLSLPNTGGTLATQTYVNDQIAAAITTALNTPV